MMGELSEKLLKEMEVSQKTGNKSTKVKNPVRKPKREEPIRPVLHTEDDNDAFLQF